MVVVRETPLWKSGHVPGARKSWYDTIMLPQGSSGLPEAWLSAPPLVGPKLLLDIPRDIRVFTLPQQGPRLRVWAWRRVGRASMYHA